ncbi:MAG: glycoside hydrolase family 20 zincin-like fold domain-containing protein, partial [Gemmatimonadota bacterium]|nr:glycoside hydrolase family 20 zincin-like fold domain-containing protein [Gemmatimonadota bacterium]
MRISMQFLAALIFGFTFSTIASASETALWSEGISLIPYPQEVTLGDEDFLLGEETAIVLDESASSEADIFAAKDLGERLKADWGEIIGKITGPGVGRQIVLTRKGAPKKLGDQGYELEVDNNVITIRAAGEA